MGIYIEGMDMPTRGHTVTITIMGSGEAYVKYYDCRHHAEEIIEYRVIHAADVRPVVRGKWLLGKEIAREYLGNECVAIYYENMTCSACKTIFEPYVMNFNYCPNCGADMKG